VSAMPVIAKTLTDMRLLHRNIGQLILVSGTVDDAFGWAMLSVVSALATSGVHAGDIGWSVGATLATGLVAVTLGRPLVRRVMRTAARSGASAVVAATVVLVLVCAAGTLALGLEPIFGAFLAGVLIGTSGEVDRAALAPLRTVVLTVFAPLFFATAGLRVDLTVLGRPAVLAAAAVLVLVAILGKFGGACIGALACRLNRWEALALGAGMNARGVVEVVVAMVGLRLGVLSVEAYTIVMLIAILTSLMAPPILRVAMRRVEHTAEEEIRLVRSAASELR
jgi:Kef-type K+ transport system membrane component KefB